jgi:uncharacterized protein (UPF0276 family)
VDWFEIISENFMVDGGVRSRRLTQSSSNTVSCSTELPLLWLGGQTQPRTPQEAQAPRQTHQYPWISDHLCRGSVDGRYAHDLLPDYLNNIPHHRVGNIYIAGHSKFEKYFLDTHDHPVMDPVSKMYGQALGGIGHTATLLKWDDRIHLSMRSIMKRSKPSSFRRRSSQPA